MGFTAEEPTWQQVVSFTIQNPDAKSSVESGLFFLKHPYFLNNFFHRFANYPGHMSERLKKRIDEVKEEIECEKPTGDKWEVDQFYFPIYLLLREEGFDVIEELIK